MSIQLLFEYSSVIYFFLLFFVLKERNKSFNHLFALGLSSLLFVESLLYSLLNLGIVDKIFFNKILVSLQILLIGLWLAAYRNTYPAKSARGFWQDFKYIYGSIIIFELLLWSGIIQFSFSGKPDILTYMIIPLAALVVLSYLAISSKESQNLPGQIYGKQSYDFLLPPMIISYLFFNHFWFPYTQNIIPVAIYGIILAFSFGIWLYKGKLIVPGLAGTWLFLPISAAFLTLFLGAAFEDQRVTVEVLSIHLKVIGIVIGISYLIFILANLLIQRSIDHHPGKDIARFSQDLYKYLNWDRLGSYVCNHLSLRFGVNRVALIIESSGSVPFVVLGQINFSETELMQLLLSKDIDWLELLNKEEQGIYIENLKRNSVIDLAFQTYKIGAVLPIKEASKLKGMIIIANEKSTPVFSSTDRNELVLLSGQIAFAMEQISLTEKFYESEKMAEIGTFASQLAHDFRSFLSVIQLAPEVTPLLKDLARQTGNMIQDLLTFVRPDELTLMPSDFNALIENSLQMINVPKEIKIEKHYAENLPEVAADINQMHRVFSNLLNNAVRAVMAKEGGRIKISTRHLRTFNIFQTSEWIYAEILDEGEGISERDLNKIFRPFFTSYKDQGGSGLGLSIVKKIIEAHGGIIDVTSVQGKGTAFNIRLPITGKLTINS